MLKLLFLSDSRMYKAKTYQNAAPSKVKSFAYLLGYDDFNPLNRWTQSFKGWSGINSRIISIESGEVNSSSNQAWPRFSLETMLAAQAIFNADKAGMF